MLPCPASFGVLPADAEENRRFARRAQSSVDVILHYPGLNLAEYVQEEVFGLTKF